MVWLILDNLYVNGSEAFIGPKFIRQQVMMNTKHLEKFIEYNNEVICVH